MADFQKLREMLERRYKRQKEELARTEAELAELNQVTGRGRQLDLTAAAIAPAKVK